ncbi:GNAT family N-acetyltransferase [Owenweeksia hongkongensis]|uniref:GNAT family N-acetyltransferase n=1 Tax=Owenweeksia hongkongensis TaxID=253245 RepID=UPI003A93FA31
MSTSFRATSTSDDLQQIETLAREIWEEHYTPIIGEAQVAYMLDKFQSVEAMQKQVKEGYEYFMLHEGEELVGYLSFKEEQDELFLSKVYVHSKVRGKGLGKTAIEFVKTEVQKRGLSQIRLTVNKYNHNSIAAYIKMGFAKTREIVMDIGEGYVMDDYEMVLRVGSRE